MSHTVCRNVVTNAPSNSTILSRRYDIPCYLDILLMIINASELQFVV